jgi:hypothetical protein
MQVDSRKRKLDPKEIIMTFAQDHEKRYPPNVTFNSIINEVKSKKSRIMQQGNTVFLVSPAKNKTAVFRALNADTAENYVANTIVFVQAMRDLGYDYLYTEFTDPSILNVLKAAFKSNIPKEANAAYKAYRDKDGQGYSAIISTGEKKGK